MAIEGKVVLVGVTGGVAAYKVGYVVSGLRRAGAEVHVLMTPSAQAFIGAVTFRALSDQPVLTDLLSADNPWAEPHVILGARANLYVVAPATAHTIAKLALGLADDLVTATALATRAPLLVAPAMSDLMATHPTVQAHLQTLRARGAHILGPEVGRLASGREGPGRMSEPEAILREARRLLGDRS